jgi:hypothetical protein
MINKEWADDFIRAGVLIDIFCNVLENEKGIVIDPFTRHALLLRAIGVLDKEKQVVEG